MDYQRYLIEFGTGADLHGVDATKAAKKAIKDAISHCCLCGMRDVLHVKNLSKALHVKVKIGAPVPDEVDTGELAGILPFGDCEFEVVMGGLMVKGMREPQLGDGDHILMVNAALTVWVDVDMASLNAPAED